MFKSVFRNSFLALAAFFVLSVVVFNVSQHQSAEEAWGSDALVEVSEALQKVSPIPLANACGLGASSCFRCHNGKRAELPNTDAEEAPWHVEHDKVNYSCAGCHKGNPRILKQDIAHKNLIANPVANPEESCVSCHGNDAKAKQQVYLESHPKLVGEDE